MSSLRTPSMMPNPRPSRPRPVLEILPDTRFIVFNGSEHEASSVKLAGRVRLTSLEPMSILKPKVRLEGKRKVSWWLNAGLSATELTDKGVFHRQEQKLGIDTTHKINAGSMEWPFEFDLDPAMPESVEGLHETYIVYHLHASVSRPGWNAKDITAQEHIRIVRTLGLESMEMTRSRVNADIWANKMSYSISIPTDTIVFGTSLTADVELSPIKKGITLGKIDLRLMETVVKRIQASEVPDARLDRTKQEESEVARAEMAFPEHSRVLYNDETVDNPVLSDEMYKFKVTLPLPKSLNQCRQDVDSHQIHVTHRFKLMVNIHNPEGHVSQLVCRLPVKLFISPNLPVDEQNEVRPSLHGVSDAQLNSTETTVTAPPVYGRHRLDQIYSDIDPTVYMSRAGSAPGTPGGLFAQSRRGSQDHSTSLNGIAVSDHGDPSLHAHGSASPSVLHSRLTDLQLRDPTLAAQTSGANLSGSPSGGTSPAPGLADSPYFASASAAVSAAQSPHITSNPATSHPNTLPTQDYNLSDLSRVPSYNAALRTSGSVTPFIDGPPTYVQATSCPPSPQSRPVLPVPVRSWSLSMAASASRAMVLPPGVGEEEGRLRMLRAGN